MKEEQTNEICHVLSKGVANKAKQRDISSIFKLNDLISKIDLSDVQYDNIKNLVEDCIVNDNIIKIEKGQKIMSSFMSYLVSSLGKLTEKILINLRTKNKQYSKSLGSIVMNCWVGCDVQERSAIEVMVIKPIIENAILGETPTLSKNSKSFFDSFKEKRRKKEVSTTIVHLFEPIVFRYIHAANALVRHNAALLFIFMFPLQSPSFSSERNLQLLDFQLSELKSALFDESPKVRSTIAKGVCRILYEWWDLIPSQSRHDLIRQLTTELCFDSSSPLVRTAVLKGIVYLLDRLESIEIIVPEIGSMGPLLHDPIESVRQEYIKLLNCASSINDVNIFTIVHIDHLIYRLKHDSTSVASTICELLHPSLFPMPSSRGKEKQTNTHRVARCIFLLRRNIEAAKKFYSMLPKHVSVDEILVFIRLLYYWSEQISIGNEPPKLPDVKMIGNDDMSLPAFDGIDDLESHGIEPYQACWAIISSSLISISKRTKSDEQMLEIKEKTLSDFDPKRVFNSLPSCMHEDFFKLLAIFPSTDSEVEIVLDYLQKDDNSAWSSALKCLMKWQSLNKFFPEQVRLVSESTKDISSVSKCDELSRSVRYLCFMFSNSELRSTIINDLDSINSLAEALNPFLTMLLIRIGIPFEGRDSTPQETIAIAEALEGQCYIDVIELIIALRVHLSLQLLIDGDVDGFNQQLTGINNDVFSPLLEGIVATIDPSLLTMDTLAFKVLSTVMTLVSDMLSLHILDGEPFMQILTFLRKCTESEEYDESPLQALSIKCLAKIEVSLAVDAKPDEEENPAIELLQILVKYSKTSENTSTVVDLIESLTKTQKKKACIPWLLNSLGDLLVLEEIDDLIKDIVSKSILILRE